MVLIRLIWRRLLLVQGLGALGVQDVWRGEAAGTGAAVPAAVYSATTALLPAFAGSVGIPDTADRLLRGRQQL